MRVRDLLPMVLAAGVAGSAALASTVIGLSIEDQTRLARLVVLGEVTSLQGVDHPEHGIETAVTLRVIDVLKGAVPAGSSLVFHTHQGEVAGLISEAPGEATFQVGQKALVFVEEIDGRLYNLGLSLGVWSVKERDGAVAAYTRAIADGLEVVGQEAVELGPISHRDMVSRVLWAASHPEFESPLLREARVAGGR
jgi:hypothetical protein